MNPDWQDMLVLFKQDSEDRQHCISAVYRKPMEGGVPVSQRHILVGLKVLVDGFTE